MRFDILTIFPNFFAGPLDHGILSRAIAAGTVEVAMHDLRDFTHDRHRTVDDRPFGGGEGMVLKAQPIFECVESLGGIAARPDRDLTRQSVILLSAQGKRFTQATALRLAGLDRVVLICGRYEGVDERVCELLADEELSIGDYVLSGGELAAAVVLDATARLLPGVLGNDTSAAFESFQETGHGEGLLDCPHWTRPADFRGWKAPEVLLNGNHEQIRRFRKESAIAKTARLRRDLLKDAPESGE